MNSREKRELGRRGALYGVWVFATLALPIGGVVRDPSRTLLLVAAIMIVVHVIGAILLQGGLRRFLASTEWATSNGYRAGDLRLFGASWKR